MFKAQYKTEDLTDFAFFAVYRYGGYGNEFVSVERPEQKLKYRRIMKMREFLRDSGDIKLTVIVFIGDAEVTHHGPGSWTLCEMVRDTPEDKVDIYHASDIHQRYPNKDSVNKQSRQMLAIFDGNICDKLIPSRYTGTY